MKTMTSSSSSTTIMLVFVLVIMFSLLMDAASSRKDRCHSDDKACCAWTSVHCDPFTGRVDDLSIFQLPDINGTIPDAIAGLVHLKTLMLHHLPGISGPIPPAITNKLTNLSLLIISWTSVSGTIPSSVGKLTQLTVLDLSFNSLSGTIPTTLGSLPYLAGINLSCNRLTGPLPSLLFSKYTGDTNFLKLSHNNLSGTIPAEFAAVDFWQIDLSRNAFTGDASPLFGVAKKVVIMDLSRNAFSFNLSGIELPEQLAAMDVSHNAIYGGIPTQVANLTKLQQFNVSYNRLCGQLPNIINRFDVFSFQHNKCLCGAPLLSPCNH